MSNAFNPYAHLASAASGDAASMRLLASTGMRMAIEDGSECAMVEALLLARMAYARTHLPSDGSAFIRMLGAAIGTAEPSDLRESWECERIALLSILADAGDDAADQALPGIMQTASRGAVADAKAIREMMTQGD